MATISFRDFNIQAQRKLKEDYPSVTVEYVAEQTSRMLSGEKADNVIGMFVESMVKQSGLEVQAEEGEVTK